MAVPVPIFMKLRIISRSPQTCLAQPSIQIALQYGHTISLTSLHIALQQISRNSGIVSGITWSSCTKIGQKIYRAGI